MAPRAARRARPLTASARSFAHQVIERAADQQEEQQRDRGIEIGVRPRDGACRRGSCRRPAARRSRSARPCWSDRAAAPAMPSGRRCGPNRPAPAGRSPPTASGTVSRDSASAPDHTATDSIMMLLAAKPATASARTSPRQFAVLRPRRRSRGGGPRTDASSVSTKRRRALSPRQCDVTRSVDRLTRARSTPADRDSTRSILRCSRRSGCRALTARSVADRRRGRGLPAELSRRRSCRRNAASVLDAAAHVDWLALDGDRRRHARFRVPAAGKTTIRPNRPVARLSRKTAPARSRPRSA